MFESGNLPKTVPEPTVVLFSGGGYQAFCKLAAPFEIDGVLDKAEEAALYNLQIERLLKADSCHNIDRIMRLPGTINVPNAKKKKAGREYLDDLTWDGQSRLNTWLTAFGGAEDSEYVQAVARIILVAAVRRVRQRGVKFDQMLVLEGAQGIGKSTLVRILAGRDEWFADEAPLGGDGKAAIEAPSGKWLVEPAELKSYRNNEAEHVKAFLRFCHDCRTPVSKRGAICYVVP